MCAFLSFKAIIIVRERGNSTIIALRDKQGWSSVWCALGTNPYQCWKGTIVYIIEYTIVYVD